MYHLNLSTSSTARDLISGLQKSNQLRVSQRMRIDQTNLAPLRKAIFNVCPITGNYAGESQCCVMLVLAGHGRDPSDDARSLQLLHTAFVNYLTIKVKDHLYVSTETCNLFLLSGCRRNS